MSDHNTAQSPPPPSPEAASAGTAMAATSGPATRYEPRATGQPGTASAASATGRGGPTHGAAEPPGPGTTNEAAAGEAGRHLATQAPPDVPHLAEGVGAIGGQALVEGVMMRRAEGWGAAVRRDDGTITTTYQPKPGPVGWRAWPLVRGVVALLDSVFTGMKALLWAAGEHTTEPDEQLSGGGMGVTVFVAVVLALGVFGVLPAVLAHLTGVKGSLGFNGIEGGVRLGLLFAYLLVLSLSTEVRRTFEYHGAEHMTIHALEHGEPLTAESIRRFNRRHPRCGTSFLVLTVIVAIVVFTFLGRPSWLLLIVSRIALLPVVAALSYEVIRFAGLHRHSWYGSVLMAPGSLVQTITTRVPDDEQIEVAVAAMHAVLAGPGAAVDGRVTASGAVDGVADVDGAGAATAGTLNGETHNGAATGTAGNGSTRAAAPAANEVGEKAAPADGIAAVHVDSAASGSASGGSTGPVATDTGGRSGRGAEAASDTRAADGVTAAAEVSPQP